MLNQLETLISHYQKALIIKPDDAILYQKIAELYQSGFSFDEKLSQAAFFYLKAIQIKPDLFKAYYPLIFTLQTLHWFNLGTNKELLETGVDILQNNIKKLPNFPFAHVVLGELLAQQGKVAQAKTSYQQASYQQLSKSSPQLVKSAWDSSHKRHPDFLVIGLFKCGTTSFYSYLTAHPQILPAVAKELRYFSQSSVNDIDYYLSHFPAISDKNYLIGEATPSYLSCPTIAEQILDWFPNIKLVILLRNPLQRTLSGFYQGNRFAYKYFKKSLNGVHSIDMNILQERVAQLPKLMRMSKNERIDYWISMREIYLDNLDFDISHHITYSLYIYYLREWFNVFPREKFLIIKSEDLFVNPAATMKQAYEFLGLPDQILPKYPNRNPNKYPPISLSLRQQLAEFFQPYNQELEDYLGKKFNWE